MRKYNGGKWTEGRFHSFIKGGLRSVSNRWPPKYGVKTQARVARGLYLCNGYGTGPHEVNASIPNPKGTGRINNVYVDHIEPVVPVGGFLSWDDIINRLFCEAEGLQVLCYECHARKTADERKERKRNGTTDE